MAQVKLSGTLPKDDTDANGLDVLASDLAMRPTNTYVVVGLVTTAKTTIDHDRSNARQPEIRFIAVEAVTDADDRAAVQRIIERRQTHRRGRNPDQIDVFGTGDAGSVQHYDGDE
jgi:hypothetical protein